MNRHPLYWKVYHSARLYDSSWILKVITALVERLGSPWPIAVRGRYPKSHPKLHAVDICIYMRYHCPCVKAKLEVRN